MISFALLISPVVQVYFWDCKSEPEQRVNQPERSVGR